MRPEGIESREDYLEAILIISERKGFVKAVDIVKELHFTKPSVSVAIKKLKESGLIEVGEHSHLTLTKKGEEIAKKTYERHQILTKLFLMMGIDEDNARKDACRVEHDISDTTFEHIKDFVVNK